MTSPKKDSAEKAVTLFSVLNYHSGQRIKVTKKDVNGDPVEGVTFKLTDTSNPVSYTHLNIPW